MTFLFYFMYFQNILLVLIRYNSSSQFVEGDFVLCTILLILTPVSLLTFEFPGVHKTYSTYILTNNHENIHL